MSLIVLINYKGENMSISPVDMIFGQSAPLNKKGCDRLIGFRSNHDDSTTVGLKDLTSLTKSVTGAAKAFGRSAVVGQEYTLNFLDGITTPGRLTIAFSVDPEQLPMEGYKTVLELAKELGVDDSTREEILKRFESAPPLIYDKINS